MSEVTHIEDWREYRETRCEGKTETDTTLDVIFHDEEIPTVRGSQFTWNSSFLSSNSRPFWWKTHWSYIARQGVVTERLRRAQLSRWKLPWLTLHNPVWIDSGWEKMSRKRRLAVFFTAVNPMFVDQHKEVEYDLTKPRIAVYKNKWKVHQRAVFLCNLRVAQSRGLQFYQTRSNAIILYNTLPAVYIEKVVNMMSREDLYSKMYQSRELQQRIVLKPNLHHERQDSTNFEARASVDHLGKEYGETRGSGEYGETRYGNIDVRIQGIAAFNCPTTRQHPQGRQSKVDSSIWNASKSRSAESRLGKGSRVQPIQREVEGHDPQHGKHWSTSRCAHDCSTYWTTSIVHCTCGTYLRPSDKKSQIKQR